MNSSNSAIEPRVLAIVPARFASTRFPGKIITPLAGKPLVMHAYEGACRAALVSETLIATDDQRVVDAVAPYGANWVLTRADHATGTDRLAEVAAQRDEPILVNVQGDEALIDPRTIDAAIRPLLEDPAVVMSTARHRISAQDAQDPNRVKVVCNDAGHALYFSRAPIPYIRDEADRALAPACYWQHVGLYAYRREFLLAYAAMAQSPLEQLEKLEQLRVLEQGYRIAVIETAYEGIGVDVPEDLVRVEALMGLEGDPCR